MPKIIDLTGQKFGRLKVIKFHKIKNNGKHFLCKCDCGNIKSISSNHLLSNHTKSCGCYKKEASSMRMKKYHKKKAGNFKPNYTHGLSSERFYTIWVSMKNRCNNYNKDYSGRGIKICNGWEKFKNFKKDMYKKYLDHVKKHGEKQTTIDRIDTDSDYCKENCRWATYKKQSNNKTNNRLINYNGETKTMSEWAEYTGIKYGTIRSRIYRNNWSIKRILETKVLNNNN